MSDFATSVLARLKTLEEQIAALHAESRRDAIVKRDEQRLARQTRRAGDQEEFVSFDLYDTVGSAAAAAAARAPADADYLVKTAHASLSAERVVTDTVTISVDWGTAGQAKFNVLAGGIPLDTLGAPTDNTSLNATAAAHGLLPKLSGNAAHTLHGDGTWS